MKEKLKKAYFLFLLLPLLAVYITGCGEANPAAPAGSVITINAEKREWKTGATNPREWKTEYLTITVYENSDKIKPMSDIEINISCPLASPTDYYVIQFYHQGERVNSPLTVKTDKYGTYILRLEWLSGGGMEYKAPIEIRSGTAFASYEIEVTVEE